jgi:uncharacterized membrane protein
MRRAPHGLYILLLAGTVPFFMAVVLADIAWFVSYEVQWKNFCSWLLIGGLLFCGLALLWELIERIRFGWREPRGIVVFCLLLVAWIVGFLDELVHARDAWASMPTALVLSTIAAVLVLAATWAGLARSFPGEQP